MNADKFSKTRRIVISRCFGISIRLKNWICSHNLIFQCCLLECFFAGGCYHSQVGDDLLCIFCLACSRLSSDEHGLILVCCEHVPVGSLCYGPQVWWSFISPLSLVYFENPWSIDWESLVGIYHNTKQSRIGVDKFCLISRFQIPENRSFIQECEVCHVFTFL